VADARKVIEKARGSMLTTVLFVDEVHRWSKSQQDVLLPAVEEGTVTLIGATTENPFFSLVSPLLSRCLLLRLEPLEPKDIRGLLERALTDERGLYATGIEADDDALDFLADAAGGDARLALSGLEAAALTAEARSEDRVTRALVEEAVQRKAIVYDEDAHYDVVSAFIKSMRGSDPDAALFWLARMLEAGEDPRFISRRMVILASEDIGPADPRALLMATAAAHAVEYVGLPEAQLNLAQVVVYLARAPKSNEVIRSLGAAREEASGNHPVPTHLRDAHYKGARKIGHGVGYVYPHADPGGAEGQRYLPDGVKGGYVDPEPDSGRVNRFPDEEERA
jgi:putative ATPase